MRRTTININASDININDSELNQEKNERMCSKYYGVVTSGIVHLCGKVQTVKSLVDSGYGLVSASAEPVASSILKTKLK